MYLISPQLKAVKCRGKESVLRVREPWVQILMPSFIVCVVLGKLCPSLNPSAQCSAFLGSYEIRKLWDFPGGTVARSLLATAGDMGSIPGPGRFHVPWRN